MGTEHLHSLPISFIHLFHTHSLITYYVPGSVLGARDAVGKKMNKNACLCGSYILAGETDKKSMSQTSIHKRVLIAWKKSEAGKGLGRAQASWGLYSLRIMF